MKFSIPRKIWGTGSKGGYLLNSDHGKMCCLGIYLQACGTPEGKLRDANMPGDILPKRLPSGLQWLIDARRDSYTSRAASRLAETNDDEHLDARTREESIKRQFKEVGISVTFRGKY